MKLRNKKTGEIREDSDLGKMLSRYEMPSFESISELCDEWEDVEEPLIKDEKVRKAVRAWAEANGIKVIIIFDHYNNAPYVPVGAVEFAGNASRLKILFRTDERFNTDRIYTIGELCGEEEECES